MLVLVLAADMNLGIGRNNGLPWSFAKDMHFFKEVTKDSTVILGSTTWAGIEKSGNRLPGREKIILSNKHAPGLTLLSTGPENYTNSLPLVTGSYGIDNRLAFVIGGAKIYKEFAGAADYAIVTKVHSENECDTFLDRSIEHQFSDELRHYSVTDTDRLNQYGDRTAQNAVKLSFTLYGSRYRADNTPTHPQVLAAYERGVNSVKDRFD